MFFIADVEILRMLFLQIPNFFQELLAFYSQVFELVKFCLI
jgi:hypothetical protein